jgi:cobalamin biosynthesis protein CobD/CbiB
MRFHKKKHSVMVVPGYAWRFLPPSVALGLRSWLFHPVAAIGNAAGHMKLAVTRRVHAALLKATGLPDPHGRHS